METLKDFADITSIFFESIAVPVRNESEKKIAESLVKRLGAVDHWEKEAILAVLREVLQEFSVRMSVLYYIFTGKEKGLPLPESLEILGKEKTLEHLQQFVK
jgi:glutamyl/glutaminyl-tRNA synthetase